MKELASMDINSLTWIALLLRQVNTRPQHLELAAPSVFLVCTIKGPKMSNTMFVKGGATYVLSAGRLAIHCSITGPASFLHVTHLINSLVTV